LLEVSTDDLVDVEGGLMVRGAPGSFVSLGQVAQAAGQGGDDERGLTTTAQYDPPMPTVANGAHLAVVDVDPETCQIKLLRHVVVDDCGRIVNRTIVEGQVLGGIAQGIGETLFEAMAYDDNAQPLTASFMDYLVPTAMEIPEIAIHHVETRSSISPTGFRGIGEGGTLGAVGAIANAVANALMPLGVRVRALPLSVVRIFDELRVGTSLQRESHRSDDA
jgi:carbon-monoxide dehydrogenase large subunit